ncbi:restriction endonuclease subunit S [Psittacicella gerlachiana]|uniref:Type I restriction modification DNA specificity domain-containing protein n=1 Tax=Psittacicella gerlachiana TaxID=2028574 RepID=A0A3A1Y5I9_9GAMM|nr:restriction endonuclease subunit S [Psittacicella gerlachiana]RIY31314.1 hypothetical protein CKF59_07730 [Psittacicella gerlachiana]
MDHNINYQEIKVNKIKKLKESLLDTLFPYVDKSIPKLRFKNFSGEWKTFKLGEIVTRVTRKNKDNISQDPLTISAEHGIISQQSFFNKIVASKDLSGYYLIKKGEFAYNKSYSSGYKAGAIRRLEAYDYGCLSTLYIVFKPKDDGISDLLNNFYQSRHWENEMLGFSTEGARNHGLLNIGVNDFFKATVKLPPTNFEMIRINKLLEEVNLLLDLHKRYLNSLKLQKQALLQRMFV